MSGTAGMFQLGRVTPEGFDATAGGFLQVPAMFAVVLNDLGGWQGRAASRLRAPSRGGRPWISKRANRSGAGRYVTSGR